VKVAAIVPAYNEERTIGTVIKCLLECTAIDEIVVVSDGSFDKTAQIAREFPVHVVELKENIGKGGAMKAGSEAVKSDILLFIDADLVGLECKHIDSLLAPVLAKRAAMSIGVFAEGRLSTDLAQKIAPNLSGQRAITRELFESVPKLRQTRYGVEVALTRYAEQHKIKVVEVPLPRVSQVMKEEKHGLRRGLRARMKMYWEIIKSIRL